MEKHENNTLDSKIEAIISKHSLNELIESFKNKGLNLSINRQQENWDDIISKMVQVGLFEYDGGRGNTISIGSLKFFLIDNYYSPQRK